MHTGKQSVREHLLMPAQGQAACWGVAPRGPTPVLPLRCSQSDGGRQCSVNPVDSMGAEGTETLWPQEIKSRPQAPPPCDLWGLRQTRRARPLELWPQPRPGVPE